MRSNCKPPSQQIWYDTRSKYGMILADMLGIKTATTPLESGI